MKRLILASTLAFSTLFSATVHADGLTFVRGQFTARVEHGQPVGDATALATAFPVVYWAEIANPGAPTQVTLTWTIDGHQVSRQSLDVGRGAHWRTWAFLPRHVAGHTVEITVLDSAGATLHTERAEVH